jgi:hypothetical protein
MMRTISLIPVTFFHFSPAFLSGACSRKKKAGNKKWETKK